MEKIAKFILIKQHTDFEITQILQQQAKKGWWLLECKGNKFIFSKKTDINENVCCHTVHSPCLGVVSEDIIDNDKDKWANDGWHIFCEGALQNVQDSRRQVFLYSNDSNVAVIEEPEGSKNGAIKRGLNKGFSNLFICISYLVATCYGFMAGRLETFMANIAFATGLVSTILGILSILYSLKLKKDYVKACKSGHYYYIDLATISTSITLGILAVYLVLSMLF